MRRLAVLLLAAVTAGCGSPPFIDLPNPLVGKVTEVSGRDAFVVTTAAGERYQFRNANPDDAKMGQTHLQQHRFDNVAVSITWRRDGYELVALKIEDASGAIFPSPTPTVLPSFPFPLPSQTLPD